LFANRQGYDVDSEVDPGVPSCQSVAYRGMEGPSIDQSTVRHEVLMAAHEGSEHAEQAERHDFGDATLEQLHARCRAAVG